jgi:hypothetical protein
MENKETLEEAAVINYKKLYEGEPLTQDVPIDAFKQGAKWREKQYTIEEQHIGHSIDDLDKSYIKGFIEGAKWMQERMYSEEDFDAFRKFMIQEQNFSRSCLDVFIQQLKKK